jgi:hypothetical protein
MPCHEIQTRSTSKRPLAINGNLKVKVVDTNLLLTHGGYALMRVARPRMLERPMGKQVVGGRDQPGFECRVENRGGYTVEYTAKERDM